MDEALGEVYLHISNSGIVFSVRNTEDTGPAITINSSVFGNLVNVRTIYTDKASLKALGEMFLAAADKASPEKYVHSASINK